MRIRIRPAVALSTALLTASALLPATAVAAPGANERPSGGGLSATIRYTEYGVPHVLADDYASLGFGTAWAQAADQVCVLAQSFTTVRGERSRYFGPDGDPGGGLSSATTNLTSDLYFRGVRQAGTVEKLLDQPAPRGPSHAAKELMRGFAAGYNAWLRQHRVTDPACAKADWVRPATALDAARLGHAVSVLGGQGRVVDGITGARPPGPGESRRAPDPRGTAQAARRMLAPGAEGADMGSNAVAFSGRTTAGGRGLLLGNPHYPWQGSRRFAQVQQTIPGELNVSGAALLGTPVVNIGFTSHVAWSHTVATGVPFNVHELTLDPADPTAYLVDGARERMTRRTVTVPVRDGAPVTRTQWWTRYGPVVTSLGSQLPLPWTARTAYALNDPNAAQLRAADADLRLGRARSVKGVLRALRDTQGLPWVNTVAADRAGHSLLTQSQVLPRITDDLAARCSTPLGKLTYPAAGVAVLDGSRGDCALGSDKDALQPGTFGPSRMPTLKDAPYAENSNDSAWLSNAERPLTGYERIFGTIGTERSMRTRGAVEDVSALARRGGLTVGDLQRQQFANRAPAGDLAAADAARACAALPSGSATGSDGKAVDVREACAVLGAWDRTMDTGSRGALLFDRFWRALRAEVPGAQLWKVPFSASDPVRTPRSLNTDAPGFATALADAVAELRAAGIPLDARLGDHQFVVRNGKRLPVHGGTESLGVWNKIEGRWNPAGGGYTEVGSGSSHVQAVGWDASRCPRARTLLTYSQSADPRSPHYSDQTRLYSSERWVTSRFCERDILKAPGLKVVKVRER
ncbi:penicillin acylase family protein [Streptomyces spectabilis]|uniref:Acylase n=1 Tax=Streptomyces spectabilis TaxID=68270 RepID=A0A5P2XLL5_STRST|nr:penicillin acylase family protein [Streptomyces spectabilis]MBB5102128.1 acyl-homoserine-lactone acylase [Streptomyces spectabilis]MCI3907177.1 penicillin acylase family protein [Streptomyces spectabilis]QEV63930.1 acylase [Streptomyces spectabilis]GGV28938.1 penicillin amidase [Streptomyces spectabilis]